MSNKAKVFNLAKDIKYAKNSIVSKTLASKKAGTITLFSFDQGQGLSEHTAPYDAVVEIVDGEATLIIGGKKIIAGKGQLVVMPANIAHAVKAERKFKMLLTMIRSR